MKLPKFLQNESNLKYFGIGSAVLILAALSKVIWMAVEGIVGLNVLAFGVGISVVVWKMIPLFLQKADNEILEMRKREARANPIAQKENRYRRGQEVIALRKKELEDILTNTRSMREMLVKREKQNPNEDLKPMWADLKLAESAAEKKRLSIIAFEQAQVNYWRSIEADRFRHKFGQTSKKTRELIGKATGDAAVEDILDQEASDAISSEYNRAFAAMDVEFGTSVDNSVIDMGSVQEVQPSLTNNPSATLSGLSISVPEYQKTTSDRTLQ